MTYSVVVTGDSILNHRVSDISERRFNDIIGVLREADVGITHFESLIHDYSGPEVYPAAEAGWTWMRSPRSTARELVWLGVDLVSLASNHALDYGVGGLRGTWAALEADGVVHAGTGADLGAARAPAFSWHGGRKIALISLTTSAPKSARAGAARPDVPGRPGVNPLAFHYAIDAGTFARLRSLATTLGLWMERHSDDRWLVHPPGLHNSGVTYTVRDDVAGADLVADAEDAAGNLAAVADAAARADITVVHIHNHEWDPVGGLSVPPRFVIDFARQCVDLGAAIVVAEGSHAPLRGVELYGRGVIVYDPGELFMMSSHVTRLPYDFFRRHSHQLGKPPYEASVADALRARTVGGTSVESPPGGYRSGRIDGGVVVRADFDPASQLERVRLFPFDRARPDGGRGALPRAATAPTAAAILEYIDDLSSPWGTRVDNADGVGVLRTT